MLEDNAHLINVSIDGRFSQAEWRRAKELLLQGGKRRRQTLSFPQRISPKGAPLITPQEDADDLQRHFGDIEKATTASRERVFEQYNDMGNLGGEKIFSSTLTASCHVRNCRGRSQG
eukprot:3450520-Pyramimonas_sp.AAC.1